MIGIYGIRNKETDQWYIGSSQELEKRMNFHKNALMNENNRRGMPSLLLEVIEETGGENFELIVLKELQSKNELESWENYYIGIYNSLNNGYNKILSRRLPTATYLSYSIKDEEMITKYEVAIKLQLSDDEFEELFDDENLPSINIVGGKKLYLLSKILTYLKTEVSDN